MTSPRTTLIDTFETCLQAIATADGYNTDAGAHVTTEPGQIDPAAPVTIVVYIDKQARARESGFENRFRWTEVLVVGKVPAAFRAAQGALDLLLQDIERAIDSQLSAFGNNAQRPQYLEMQPIPPAAGDGWVGAAIRYGCHIPIRT